jgi:hypothetical protein
MARSKSLPTIWEIPDELWERIEWLINEYDPPKNIGRWRADARRILDGIIFRRNFNQRIMQRIALIADDANHCAPATNSISRYYLRPSNELL